MVRAATLTITLQVLMTAALSLYPSGDALVCSFRCFSVEQRPHRDPSPQATIALACIVSMQHVLEPQLALCQSPTCKHKRGKPTWRAPINLKALQSPHAGNHRSSKSAQPQPCRACSGVSSSPRRMCTNVHLCHYTALMPPAVPPTTATHEYIGLSQFNANPCSMKF